jgi:hypothetical protein
MSDDRQRRIDLVNEMLSEKRIFVGVDYGYEQTEAQQISARTPADILDDAVDVAETLLPHGIEMLFERNVAFRAYDVTAQCPHCGAQHLAVQVTEGAIEAATSTSALGSILAEQAQHALPECIIATCCDQLDRFVDGLTVRECLARYEAWQREDVRETNWAKTQLSKPAYQRAEYLTLAQVSAARAAWSSSLRSKQEQASEKQRVDVCVDDDRWDP